MSISDRPIEGGALKPVYIANASLPVDLIAGDTIAVQFIDENGTAYGIKQIDGKPRVSAMDYLYDIAEGNVSGHSAFSAFGERTAIAVVATGADIWTGTATTIPVPADAGERMSIVSTSANDDVGNTGVTQVEIHYLDANGDEQSEIINMDGLNPVHTVATNIRFVQYIHTYALGTAYGAAIGNITLYKFGAAATVYARIPIGANASLSSARMIPRAHTFYMLGGYATATGNKPIALRLRMTCSPEGILTPGIWQPYGTMFQDSSGLNLPFPVPIKVPALTKIKVSAFATQAGGDASVGYFGWIEEDE